MDDSFWKPVCECKHLKSRANGLKPQTEPRSQFGSIILFFIDSKTKIIIRIAVQTETMTQTLMRRGEKVRAFVLIITWASRVEQKSVNIEIFTFHALHVISHFLHRWLDLVTDCDDETGSKSHRL